jgi:hypothetical protein
MLVVEHGIHFPQEQQIAAWRRAGARGKQAVRILELAEKYEKAKYDLKFYKADKGKRAVAATTAKLERKSKEAEKEVTEALLAYDRSHRNPP